MAKKKTAPAAPGPTVYDVNNDETRPCTQDDISRFNTALFELAEQRKIAEREERALHDAIVTLKIENRKLAIRLQHTESSLKELRAKHA